MLVNGLLKDELGFQGFVVSDWFGQISGVPSALAGLDMAMPGDGAIPLLGIPHWGYKLSRSVLNGMLPLEKLNDMVRLRTFHDIHAFPPMDEKTSKCT